MIPSGTRKLLATFGRARRNGLEALLATDPEACKRSRMEEFRLIEAARRPSQENLRRIMIRFFRFQEKTILAAYRREFLRSSFRSRAPASGHRVKQDPQLIVSTVFSGVEWDETLAREIDPGLLEALRDGFLSGALRIEAPDINFALNQPTVAQAITENVNLVRGINETTRSILEEAIRTAVNNGADLNGIQEAIQREFDTFTPYRARRIARTSGVKAFETGQQAAFEEAEIERKEWLSQRDDRVRQPPASAYNHVAADGQQKPLREPYDVSDQQLMFPGDTSLGATAGNVINCRCSSIPLV